MSVEIVKYKLQKHKAKIMEAFRRYGQKGELKVGMLKDIMADIGYISGTVFCMFKEYEATQ